MKRHFTKMMFRSLLLMAAGWFGIANTYAQFEFVIEAENTAIFGNSTIHESTYCSGGKFVGDMNASSYLKFEVTAPEEGWYALDTYYITVSTRSVYVKVNKQVKSYIEYTDYTAHWDGSPSEDGLTPGVLNKSGCIYMLAGKNEITIGTHGSWAPNFDKFIITKSETSCGDVPLNEIAVWKYSYVSDINSRVRAIPANGTVKNLKDCDEYTTYNAQTTNATLILTCTYPVLPSAYLIATESSRVDDWVMESSKDSIVWTTLDYSVKTKVVDGLYLYETGSLPGSSAAKYFRLKAIDNTNVVIGEWQLFGVPYLAEGKNFPEDITVGMDISPESPSISAGDPGFYAEGMFDERPYHLFDRDINTKYCVISMNSENKWPYWAQIEIPGDAAPHYYTLTSCSDKTYVSRDPKTWKLMGWPVSEEGWVELDAREGFTFPAVQSTMRFDIANPEMCYVFKLEVTANRGGGGETQLSKLQFFDIKDIPDPNPDTSIKPILYSNELTAQGAKGNIIITQKDSQSVSYQIFNLMGQLVTEGTVTSDVKTIPVNAGLYIIKLAAANADYSAKVIVK